MTRLKISLANSTCECSCNMCDSKFTVGSLTEKGIQEFREAISSDAHYCVVCKRYLNGIPTRSSIHHNQSRKDRLELWNKLRCFRIKSTGIVGLDAELKDEFGDWLNYKGTQPIWGT